MFKVRALWIGWVGTFTLLIGPSIPTAWSQGMIIDRRSRAPVAGSYEIREVSIDGHVRDQVAEVQISQTFHNPGSLQLDAEFLFPLPEDGAVQNFVLLVDGRELPGRLVPKDEARRIYEEIVRTKRDPALLEYMGRGLYRTSVFPIPPAADRKVTMRYTQICKRERDVIEFVYPLGIQKFTAKPIQRLIVQLSIQNKESIKSIYCPSDEATIRRQGDHDVDVRLERHNILLNSDFRLVVTLAEGAFAASVLSYRPNDSEDGYFLVLASPQVKPINARPQPKTVVFVLDRSGSMLDKKIEQARRALKTMLNNLHDEDLFNIIVYDDAVESFRPELQRYSSQSRQEAERFVDNIREGGSTNIDSALTRALAALRDSIRTGYVLFMTDGLPTAGEVDEYRIADNCKRNNERSARLFCFGVGYDVNARLLDRLSGGNSGATEYVRPDEDLETHVARFYSKMTSPVLTGLHLELASIDTNRTYPRQLSDLFDGGQLIVAGRYRLSGKTTLRITGKIGDDVRQFEFPVELASSRQGTNYDFVERLWAVRRLGDLIDQIDLKGQNKELVDEVVSLSMKYGLLTPYTSFLADERVPLHARRENAARAGRSLQALNEFSGQYAVDQRDLKQKYMAAERATVATQENQGQVQVPRRKTGALDAVKSRSGMAAMGGMGGMMGRGVNGQAGNMPSLSTKSRFANPSVTPGQVFQENEQASQYQAKVRQIGTKTFYFKNARWIDSAVTPEEDAKAIKLIQFSDDYFRIARTQKAEYNQYLSQSDPVTVKLDGVVYQIDLAPKDASR